MNTLAVRHGRFNRPRLGFSSRPRRIGKTEFRFTAFGLVLAGALSGLDIHVLGTLPIGEIILLSVFVLNQAGAFQREGKTQVSAVPRLQKWLIGFQVLATLSLVLSDAYRGSYPSDFMRGWTRMILLLLDIVAFATLDIRLRGLLVYFQYGLIGSIVALLIKPPLFGDYWKFGFGISITLLVPLFLPKLSPRIGVVLGLAAMGAVNLFMGFRSLAIICGVTSILVFIVSIREDRRVKIAVGLGALGLIALLLGKDAIMERRTEGGAQSTVERSAMMEAAWSEFVDSPLIGQGSWFSRSDLAQRFVTIRAERADEVGGLGFDDNAIDGLAIHSQILVTLAEGGFFGGAFFIAYSVVLVRALWQRIMLSAWTDAAAWEIYILVEALLSVLISPFSGVHRLHIAFAAVLAVSVLTRLQLDRNKGVKTP